MAHIGKSQLFAADNQEVDVTTECQLVNIPGMGPRPILSSNTDLSISTCIFKLNMKQQKIRLKLHAQEESIAKHIHLLKGIS